MASPEKLKEAFSRKIDSYEAWVAVCYELGLGPDFIRQQYGFDIFQRFVVGGTTYVDANNKDIKKSWWHYREAARSVFGVYAERPRVMTEFIHAFKLSAFHVNVSREDPLMVMYTPTVEDGQRDKQIRTSFGKLMRKMSVSLQDEDIQLMESMYRSEQDPSFEVARTIQDIYRVYTEMEGDTGCMRYKSSQWEWAKPKHPSNVYAYPGIGVAYTEYDGKVKSRTVIYENPDNPADKRYVRLYGDPVLKRKLEKAGFKQGSLNGARLAAIKTGRDKDHYVMPYIDGPGGDQSSGKGRWVAKFQGEDFIRVMDREVASRLRDLDIDVQQADSTGGAARLRESPLDKLHFTCALSGQTVNILDTPIVVAEAYIDGQVVKVLQSALLDHKEFHHVLVDYDGETGDWRQVYLKTDDYNVLKASVPSNFSEFINSAKNYREHGYVQLSEQFGYDRSWVSSNTTMTLRREADDDTEVRILTSDAYRLVDPANGDKYFHVSEVGTMKKSKDYVSVLPINGMKSMTRADNPAVVTLPNGKKALTTRHELKKRYDGVWDFERNTSTRTLYGGSFVVSRNDHSDIPLTPELIDEFILQPSVKYVERNYDTGSRAAAITSRMGSLVRHGWKDFGAYVDANGKLLISTWSTRPGWDTHVAAAERIVTMTDADIEATWWPGVVDVAKQWAGHILVINKGIIAAKALWKKGKSALHDVAVTRTSIEQAVALLTDPQALTTPQQVRVIMDEVSQWVPVVNE